MIVKAVENNTEDAELTDQYNKLAYQDYRAALQSQGKTSTDFPLLTTYLYRCRWNLVEPSGQSYFTALFIKKLFTGTDRPGKDPTVTADHDQNQQQKLPNWELTEPQAEEDKLYS